MVALTERAVSKVKEIVEAQVPKPAGLRIAVVGGGCSGFSYSMSFENNPGMLDKAYNSDGFKVFVDFLFAVGRHVERRVGGCSRPQGKASTALRSGPQTGCRQLVSILGAGAILNR